MGWGNARRMLMLGSALLGTQMIGASMQTTAYIAVHSTPKYANAPFMPYANPHAPKGGILSSASLGTFDNLNSMNGKGNAVSGVNYLFDTLMTNSLDEPGVMYPLLASKVRFDPQKTHEITFYLNPKARFSDGSPVSAADVKFTFDCYLTKANLGLQMYLADLAQVRVLSASVVHMQFKSAHNSEMPLIVAQLPIYSQKDWQRKDFSKITLQPILGSGPYVIDRIDAGRSVSYKRNPKYWAKDLPVNRGRYNFDRLKYVYYRSNEIAFEGFKSGQYTLHQEDNARQWVSGYQFPAVKAGQVVKYRFAHHNPISTQSFVFNTRHAPLNDIYFRQALSYAYDFEWQNKALLYGQYQRLQSYFNNSELEAKGMPTREELSMLQPYLAKLHPLQRQGVLKNWRYPVSDGDGFNRRNLLIARQVLLNAGYRYKNTQLLDRRGQPIHIEFLIQPDVILRSLMPYVRNLKRLGIQVTVRQVDAAQYTERMRRNNFQMTINSMPQSLRPGSEQAQFWGSAAADQAGNYNIAGIKNPAIDDAIAQLIRAPNREQLVLRTRVLDRLLRAGYYQIPTYGKGQHWLAYWNMYQQPQRKAKLSTGIDYWWSNAEKTKHVRQYLGAQRSHAAGISE